MKYVRVKIGNNEYVDLEFDYFTETYKGRVQVPAQTSYYEPGHYYPITFDAKDEFDNTFIADDTDPDFGQALRVRVREKATPTITVTTPHVVHESSLHIEFSISDLGGSGLNLDSVQMKFGTTIFDLSSEYVTYTETATGIRVTLAPPFNVQDGIYTITIQAGDYDENLTILPYIYQVITDVCYFITDRTQEDVNYVKELREKYLNGTITDDEKAEYATDLKGARNKGDFERILIGMGYIADMFDLDYYMPELPDIPTESYLQLLIEQVAMFRSSLPVHATTPPVPSLPINTYQKMNDLEQILYDAHENLKYRFDYYCGAAPSANTDVNIYMPDETNPDDAQIGTLE